ncbi:DUF6389 family protein [Agromyces mediolanus]|uniref:DUF6389 family protein n=1 Tax=Agromyces mediolanus TaxID=41986 RepID=UPI00203D6F59|nr:DUF6389 family protein [Agromyces mediolanus]MCM3658864.1 DUF6389 family protein [Agromyces mediolanus]
MDASAYAAALRTQLDRVADAAAAKLERIVAAAPDAAEELQLLVHPDQDGEGGFSIVATLAGPDAFVLNRAIEADRTLFEVVHGAQGPIPAVPMFAPGRAGFEVRDAIVDTASGWLVELWDRAARGRSPIPGYVAGIDGWGTVAPVELDA